MSSWIEAAWTVRKIEESLQIPEKIRQYNQRLNSIESEIDDLQNSADMAMEEVVTVQELNNSITKIFNQTQDIKEKKKLAFLAPSKKDTSGAIKNEPDVNLSTIYPDSIWFVLEEIS